MKRPKPLLSDTKFVLAWKRARCIDDMVIITGLSKNHIYVRARRMRRKGVNLVMFSETSRFDAAKLNKLLEEGSR